MPDTQMVTQGALTAQTVEAVLLGGDLSKLAPEQRVAFYTRTCESIGLNPLTRPFDYITLNGKLTLYARKDAADQLRKLHQISVDKPDITFQDDWIIVTVLARTPDGRTDADTGVVNKKDMRGDFGNALMKAVTKAKRRVTLSICGLGMMDETEVEAVPSARPVAVDVATGEIHEALPAVPGSPVITQPQAKRLFAIAKEHGWTTDTLKAHLAGFGYAHTKDIVVAHYDDIVASLEQGSAS